MKFRVPVRGLPGALPELNLKALAPRGFIITTQSILLAVFCGYLLVGPVPTSSDIVAAALAYGLLAIIICAIITTLIQAAVIKKRLALIFYPPDQSVVSNQLARSTLKAHGIALLPGFRLDCRLLVVNPGLVPPLIQIRKGWSLEQWIPIDLNFPHRGNWEINGIECIVGDLTGFSRISWKIPFSNSIVVSPPPQPDTLLPLVSSTQRAGDLVTDATHRNGDPYDIKPYHPSDGLKKIIWKAFAKSGQLLSRQPEASVVPEGFVAIFVLAKAQDDELCAKALGYVKALMELKLELLLSCAGQGNRSPGFNFESAQSLLIDSVWDAEKRGADQILLDLQSLLDASIEKGAHITLRKMVVFIAGSRVASSDGESIFESISEWMEARGIEPVFFITKHERLSATGRSTPIAQLMNLFLEQPADSKQIGNPTSIKNLATSNERYKSLLSKCLARQWEVYIA